MIEWYQGWAMYVAKKYITIFICFLQKFRLESYGTETARLDIETHLKTDPSYSLSVHEIGTYRMHNYL